MIYLDNSATTEVSESAAKKMQIAAQQVWGNPSSLHEPGLAAARLVNESRENILAALGVKDKRAGKLIFCGSGTEANNLAIFGTAYAKKHPPKKRIITDDSQHPSVLAPLKRLEENGFEIIRIPTAGGRLDTDMLVSAVNDNTILVTVMLVNNETGSRYDIERAFRSAKAVNPNVVCHTDAVQGFMKIKFTPESTGADLITLSGHKLHAPKGIGALYISQDILRAKKIIPWILGGGQEDGYRSGTENVPAIAAFGEAVKANFNIDAVESVRKRILSNISPEIRPNIPAIYAPHIISLTLPGIKSETAMHFLSSRGIYVSNGSACSSRSRHMSSTLLSYGLSKKETDCTIRVSLCGKESLEDADAFCDAVNECVRKIIRIK